MNMTSDRILLSSLDTRCKQLVEKTSSVWQRLAYLAYSDRIATQDFRCVNDIRPICYLGQ